VLRQESFDTHSGETMLTLFHMDGDRVMLTDYCLMQGASTVFLRRPAQQAMQAGTRAMRLARHELSFDFDAEPRAAIHAGEQDLRPVLG
jgi:hypothetical protein